MKFFEHLRTLCPIEVGPWWSSRQYVYQKMRELGVRAGDIICRRGNAYMYGFIPFSDVICWITGSNYSHAALVLDVSDDILIADVNTTGLRRQFITDWTDDVRGDEILVLRYSGDPVVSKLAVENARAVLAIDPAVDEEFLDSNDGRNFYCVELVCWCYMRAGVMLCQDVPICKLPNWKKWYGPIAKIHRLDYTMPVWCVGNKEIGLLSSPHLEVLGNIPYCPIKRLQQWERRPHTFAGA